MSAQRMVDPALRVPIDGGGDGLTLWDTHCHLGDAAFDRDRDAVWSRARAAGVVAAVVVGASPQDWPAAARVVASDGPVAMHLAVGLHPHEARVASPGVWDALEEALGSPRTVALGEIGLDYHYNLSSSASQQRAFAHQLELAARLGFPIILHEREAAADLLEILRAVGVPPAGGVWHCFSGDAAQAEAALGLGLHLGFGGLATFPKGTDSVRAAACACPRERLLLETDAPYLAPSPHRGGRNEPARVLDVAVFLARLRSESLGELAASTSANAGVLFARAEAGGQ